MNGPIDERRLKSRGLLPTDDTMPPNPVAVFARWAFSRLMRGTQWLAGLPGWAKRRGRRWLQFCLRTLLVLMTLFALWLGYQVDRVRQQTALVAAIDAAHRDGYCQICRVMYDYQFNPAGKFLAKATPPGPTWLRKLIGDEYFRRVRGIHLNVNHANVLENVRLSGFCDLEDFQVGFHPALSASPNWCPFVYPRSFAGLGTHKIVPPPLIHDKELAELSRLLKLKTLILYNADITDDALAHLQKLPRLEDLRIESPNITDAGVDHLAKLKNLRTLALYEHRLTKQGVNRAQGVFSKLGMVDVHPNPVIDAIKRSRVHPD